MSQSTVIISWISRVFFFFIAFIFFVTFISITNAADTLTGNHTIRDDGTSSIESSGGVFELGFFSPGRSTNRYVGIWYKKISTRTVIWIANRQTPILDSNSGVLRINKASLEIYDGANVIWSTNSSSNTNAGSVIVQLLDTGNLVMRNGNDTSNGQDFIWQSFDFPTDTLLQDMKIGWDLDRGLERSLESWKSNDDPSIGDYTQRVSRNGYPQMLVSKDSVVQFRFGPWDGIQFSGVTFSRQDLNFQLSLVRNDQEIYTSFGITGNSDAVIRYMLLSDGSIQVLSWDDQSKKWDNYLSVQRDACDQYAVCGAYGNCNNTKSRDKADCGCLGGYVPKSLERWRSSDWSDGCVRRTQFDCRNGSDIFDEYSAMKLPDTRTSWFNQTMGLADCKKECIKNCSCTAYSNIDIRQGGTGCLLWFNELFDIRDFKDTGLKFYVRTSASNREANRSSTKKKGGNSFVIIIAVLVVVAVLTILIVIFLFRRRKIRRRMRRRHGRLALNPQTDTRGNDNESKDLELPLFDFQTVANATDNFSLNNKLGEGGFGPVYKGILGQEQEIAVKRLSKTSRQGLDEFKNEVSCIAKLQHRNLVRLLGCCIEHDEMMLIYEYMPNKSLDTFIFDKEFSKLLDWPKRYNIIKGIAKGLLYLHQDSRLRIIHRDLKTSNVLLDHEMSPRISDFGLARTFGGNETGVNTAKVVGTYGYMSPEYAIDGFFSVKSDVYSFGVVVLEIVSGNKIRGFFNTENNLNLLGQAWKVYKEGNILDLVDEAFKESCNNSEVLRAVQIGLLCVQPYPKDRPNMRFIVSMLGNDNELPEPTQQPGVFHDRRIIKDSDTSSSVQGSTTSNELSMTVLNPR